MPMALLFTVKYPSGGESVQRHRATGTGPQGVPQQVDQASRSPLVLIDMDSPTTFEDGQPKKTV